MKLIRLYFILFFVVIISCSKEKERNFYPNGKLLDEVLIKNGKWNGLRKEYYEDGSLKGYWTWKDGKLDGKSVLYFKNGKPSQENNYKNGMRCCESRFYSEHGNLIEIQNIDQKGRVFDYQKYKKNGTRDFNLSKSNPIIFAITDTVEVGSYYEVEIRLGNRRWDSIRVVLGKWDDYQSLFNESLPSIDSVTSYAKVKAEKSGEAIIEGTIIEVNTNSPDSANMFPFRHYFFVKDKKPYGDDGKLTRNGQAFTGKVRGYLGKAVSALNNIKSNGGQSGISPFVVAGRLTRDPEMNKILK